MVKPTSSPISSITTRKIPWHSRQLVLKPKSLPILLSLAAINLQPQPLMLWT